MAERRKRNEPKRQQSSNPGPSSQGRRGTVETTVRPSEATGREAAMLRVLCDVLSRMSRTPAGKPLDVNPLLRTVGEAVDTDRVYIFRLRIDENTNRRYATLLYEWSHKNVTPQIDNPEMTDAPFDEMPVEVIRKLGNGESVVMFRDEVEGFAREQMDKQEIQSLIFAPIRLEHGLWGFAGFDHCREVRHWTEAERDTLTTFAGALGIAANCNQL